MKRLILTLGIFSALAGGWSYAAETHSSAAPDNSEINKRDQDPSAVTPESQSSDRADIETTRRIRKELTDDDSLSTLAKNIKIITQQGKVTLRGPVNSPDEKAKIAKKAEQVAGAGKVDDELEVKSSTMR